MKTLITLILTLASINAFADINRFPRSKIVTGAKAQRIYEEMSEGAFQNSSFWAEPGYAAGGKPAEAVSAKNCPTAFVKRGLFKPRFLSTFDGGTCRTEGGQFVCRVSTSGHAIFDSKKKSEKSAEAEGRINPACKNISSDDCIATAQAGIEDLCD